VGSISTPQFGATYVHSLNHKTSFNLSYQFALLKNDSMGSVRLYSNGLTAGFSLHFK
jgi:hypothetical protein